MLWVYQKVLNDPDEAVWFIVETKKLKQRKQNIQFNTNTLKEEMTGKTNLESLTILSHTQKEDEV